MVSVATSAAAQVAFAETLASNRRAVITSGFLALIAGILWFLLSERMGSATRRIDALAAALNDRDTAVRSISEQFSGAGLWLFSSACGFSIIWPWTQQLGELIPWAYHLVLLGLS
jgi:hypothetical protein